MSVVRYQGDLRDDELEVLGHVLVMTQEVAQTDDIINQDVYLLPFPLLFECLNDLFCAV